MRFFYLTYKSSRRRIKTARRQTKGALSGALEGSDDTAAALLIFMSATTRKGLTFAELQSRFPFKNNGGFWLPVAGPFKVKHILGNAEQRITAGEEFFCSMLTTNSRDTVLKVHRSQHVIVREANARKTAATPSWWIDAKLFELVSE